jgi:hypothetical protein
LLISATPVRTKIRYEYSYIEGAAVKIGDDVLEVSSWGQYFLNGVESAELPATIGGRSLNHTQLNPNEHHFVIPTNDLGGDIPEHILVSTFKDFVSVHIKNGFAGSFGESVGIMGNYYTGAMLDRNGKEIHDPNEFGQAWQVLDTDPRLFQTVLGPQYPEKCILPEVTSESRRRLGETIARTAAEEACSHHPAGQEQKNCVFDVMATGDIDLAYRTLH